MWIHFQQYAWLKKTDIPKNPFPPFLEDWMVEKKVHPQNRIVREIPLRDIPTWILRVCWITYMDPISGTPVCWPIFFPPSSSHQRSQVPFRGGNPRPVMLRSPSAHSAPLGYLSRQLGLAAVPLKPSAWVAWVKFWGNGGGNFKGDHRPGDGNQELPGKKPSWGWQELSHYLQGFIHVRWCGSLPSTVFFMFHLNLAALKFGGKMRVWWVYFFEC